MKIPLTQALSHKGRGNFPSLMGNVIELRYCAALSGLKYYQILIPGLSPWAILCQPFEFCFEEKNTLP
jgi:hypothetical protein